MCYHDHSEWLSWFKWLHYFVDSFCWFCYDIFCDWIDFGRIPFVFICLIFRYIFNIYEYGCYFKISEITILLGTHWILSVQMNSHHQSISVFLFSIIDTHLPAFSSLSQFRPSTAPPSHPYAEPELYVLLRLVDIVVCDVSRECDLWLVLVERERCRSFVWIYIFSRIWDKWTHNHQWGHCQRSEALLILLAYLQYFPKMCLVISGPELPAWLWQSQHCLLSLPWHKLNEDTHTHTYTPNYGTGVQ